MSLFSTYVLLLIIIPAAAAFIGMGLVGYKVFFINIVGIDLGIKFAIIVASAIITTYFVGALAINALAPTFKAQSNINEAAKLSGYTLTAACVAGIFFILPSLYVLGMLGALYGVYIMYMGIGKTMKVPEDQKVAYMLVSCLIMIVVYWAAGEILSRILMDMGAGNVRLR
jgi:hypothetical protein